MRLPVNSRMNSEASVVDMDWEQVQVKAAEILSPPQLAFFQSVEPPGGGVLHARWSAAVQRALKQDVAGKAAQPKK